MIKILKKMFLKEKNMNCRFLYCGHHKRFLPIWNEVAIEIKGKVNIGKIDATGNPIMEKKYKIEGFLTILTFFHGIGEKKEVKEYELSRKREEIVKNALEIFKSM